MQPLLVLCACPDEASAARIAQALVEERLAACVTRFSGARSVYRWQGAIEQADEVQLLIKTAQSHYAALERRVLALHPYDVPEVLVLPVVAGHGAYLDWMDAQLGQDAGTGCLFPEE